MTPGQAGRILKGYLGDTSKKNMLIQECENVYGIRKFPGQMLCVVKKTGEIMREEDLPEDLIPIGPGQMHIVCEDVP